MRLNALGMSPRTVVNAEGITAQVPYAIPSQGVFVSSLGAGATIAALPIEAAEDPRFGPILTRLGIYRIEDPASRVVRIGEGRILDRVRRHRASPVVRPVRLVAATPVRRDWTVGERVYLETCWAEHSRRIGDTLASDRFVQNFPAISEWHQVELDRQFELLLGLVDAAIRLLEGDRRDEFVDVTEIAERDQLVGQPFWSSGGYARRYEVGTVLQFEDASIRATAKVRDDGIWLMPNSLVHARISPKVGRIFARDHQQFLQRVGGVAIDEDRARTTLEACEWTAAALLKRVTAGRLHNSDRWVPLWRSTEDEYD